MAPAAQHALHPTFTATPGSVGPTDGAPVNVSQVHWYERVNHESKVGGDCWGEEVCKSPWPGPGQVKENRWMCTKTQSTADANGNVVLRLNQNSQDTDARRDTGINLRDL